jgi:GT2 family glycosyltransferase
LAAKAKVHVEASPSPEGAICATAVVVVHNERRTIVRRIRNLLKQQPLGVVSEVVVVDDGSTDGTGQAICDFFGADSRVRLISGSRAGKAAGVAQGVAEANCSRIVLCDARQIFERHTVKVLLDALSEDKVGLAAGEIWTLDERFSDDPPSSLTRYWQFVRDLRRSESRVRMLCGVSGAIYAVRKDAFPFMPQNLVLDDVYVPIAIAEAGWRTVVVPQARAWDHPWGRVDTEGARRRRNVAGVMQLARMKPYWLLPVSRVRLGFVVHKVLRAFSPAVLSMAILAGAGLAGGPILVVLLVLALIGTLTLASARRNIAGQGNQLALAPVMFLSALNGIVDAVRGKHRPSWRRTGKSNGPDSS